MKYLLILLASASTALAQPTPQLLAAIRTVESHGDDSLVGDNGKAIGPFQIWRAYWLDACQYDPSLKSGKYEDCFNYDYARRVVIAYLSRYGKGKTDEQLARIHNGGPSGHKKSSTLKYWKKVKKELDT